MRWSRPRRGWSLLLAGTTPDGTRILLRPMRVEDQHEYTSVRSLNRQWLGPWDATSPVPSTAPRTFEDLVEVYQGDALAGRMVPLVIETDGRLVGQINASNIVLGSFRSCTVGYWVAQSVAGRGIVPTALALVSDHLIGELGLHRIEINIRPENAASLAVVRKLGFRDEGVRARMLHIDGDWRDHRSFALTTEDLAGATVMDRLTHGSQQSRERHTVEGPTD
ncbi:GNAT family N-acetyltransferase [Knoellia sp. Soil729]|uniref:GNAT family N-acetyltransferase n=1 Tax=Knoellia sp. Soil729 TaxID=1736394 RepID=UPI0006F1E875|nr:GNAT family protein [Knoellia sp. Soil729]KRE43994.1 alanine acetyltransferase [Knoellia sp. Soil729]